MAQQHLGFEPRDLIDRQAEQELFRDLVSFTSPVRMLTISDSGGRGKSSLLKRLQHNCRWEIKPEPIPACLIELDRVVESSLFSFIAQVVEGLNIPDRFADFSRLNTARLTRDFTVFSQGGTAQVHNSLGAGSVAAGIYAERATIQYSQILEFTEEQEQFARQKCVDAFFGDLRAISAAQPLVLILDAWERCNIELRNLIIAELLAKHCFHRDKNLRPDKLVIVVAGRPYDRANEPRGLRDDEFCRLFADEQEYAATVKSQKSLSAWEAEHVRAWLVLNGFSNPSEIDLEFISERLKQGISFDRLLALISLLKG